VHHSSHHKIHGVKHREKFIFFSWDLQAPILLCISLQPPGYVSFLPSNLHFKKKGNKKIRAADYEM